MNFFFFWFFPYSNCFCWAHNSLAKFDSYLQFIKFFTIIVSRNLIWWTNKKKQRKIHKFSESRVILSPLWLTIMKLFLAMRIQRPKEWSVNYCKLHFNLDANDVNFAVDNEFRFTLNNFNILFAYRFFLMFFLSPVLGEKFKSTAIKILILNTIFRAIFQSSLSENSL